MLSNLSVSRTLLHSLHVVKNAQPEFAGVCRIISLLAPRLMDFGYRTTVVCLGDDGPLAVTLNSAGATVRTVRWTGGRRDPRNAVAFLREVRRLKPDLVHVHHGGYAVRLVARTAGAKSVVQHVHSRVLESTGHSYGDVSFRGADVVIATSHAVASVLKARRVEVIHPGIDVGATIVKRPPRSVPVLGCACRLVPLKGVSFLLAAMGELRDRGIDVRLQIAGSGGEESSLREQARGVGIADRVEFLGWRDDIQQVMSGWDISIVPSLEEGFGLAALEAMAGGIPVIATRVGGLTELMAEGRTGYLVPPGNSSALASAIAALATDHSRRSEMGSAGWQRATAEFTSPAMAKHVASLYNGLLAASTHA